MRTQAVRLHAYGGPEALRWEEIDVEAPARGEALVRHTAIGLNFIDIHHRTGRYSSASFPVIPGMEGAGRVEAVGAGVTDFHPGDRVAYLAHAPGAYLGSRTIPVSRLVHLPDAISDDVAAAIMLKGLTTQYLLRGAYAIRPGDIALIHAAAGGVGLLMCQWARALGARVIGTVSTEEKAEVARQYGCDHVVVNTREDVVARVRELTGGAGVPVAYDSVGAATFDLSLACLHTRGTLVSFGTSSGPVPPFDVFRLNRNHQMGQGGSLYLTSASVFDYTRDRSEYLSRAVDLFEAVTTGRIRVPLTGRYALKDAARAHGDLESRRTTGCAILYP